jgi:translocation and assembly module TamA
VVESGPLYMLRSVRVRDPRGNSFPDEVLPERVTRVHDDVPARSATVLAREAKVVDRFRALATPSPRRSHAMRWWTTRPTSWM